MENQEIKRLTQLVIASKAWGQKTELTPALKKLMLSNRDYKSFINYEGKFKAFVLSVADLQNVISKKLEIAKKIEGSAPKKLGDFLSDEEIEFYFTCNSFGISSKSIALQF